MCSKPVFELEAKQNAFENNQGVKFEKKVCFTDGGTR